MLAAHEKLRLIQGEKSLKRLIQVCPDLWQETGNAINQRLGTVSRTGVHSGNADNLNSYVQDLAAKADGWLAPLKKARWNLGMVERAFPDLIRARMARLALQNYYLGALAGKGGKIRFNWWNGTLLQKLLFHHGFERKPVNLFWYDLLWPLVSQKKILMRLVYKKGIYCFYSRRFIRDLVALVRELSQESSPTNSILEIAAGDGTLARFLRNAGLETIACDDYSWEATAKVAPDEVLKLDAASALRQFKPKVVICSWPPAGNQFEREVFATTDTLLYVVIGSRHQFASGDRSAYATAVGTAERPGKFSLVVDTRLAQGILPRELDNEVLVFRRR